MTSGRDLRLSRSTPLAQITAGIALGQASAARWARRCWAGSAISTASDVEDGPRGRRSTRIAGCQADARQMQAVLPLGRQCGGLLGAPGPEGDLAAGALGDDRQRRAPGSRSHDADAPDHGGQ